MDILRIAALGTAGVLLGITVKGAKPEFALLVTVGAGLCILAGTVGKMQYLLGMLAQMKSYLPVDSSYLNTLLKMQRIQIQYAAENAWDHVCGAVFRRDL